MTRAAPFLLAALVVVQAGLVIANASATYDETVYLHMAEAALQQRDNADFAAKGVAPLPILLAYALPAKNDVTDVAQAILLARMSAIAIVAVPLVLVVYFWLCTEIGAGPAALAAAVVALSPNMVAHGAIATTDACFVLCSLLTLWALSRYIERPGALRVALLLGAGGLAFAAKYSGVVLAGVAAIAIGWMDRPLRTPGARMRSAIAVAAGMIAAGIALTWTYHPIDGLLSQANHQRLGHEAFLLGERSTTGWWYYQPLALAFKSTYVEIAAFVVAAVALIAARRDRPVATRIWGLAAAVVLGLSMISRVSIGVRYVLLVVPLAIMLSAVWLARISAARPAIAAAAAAVAVLAQASAAWSVSPRPLSYFNGIAGGPMNGYRLLADSNLDWGQDLPAMRQVLASVGAREPLAAYFGSAPPEAYGVHIWPWNIAGADVRRRADWIVISATYLDGLYLANDPFESFRAIAPTARPTPTLFLFDAARPDVKAALAQAMARSPAG